MVGLVNQRVSGFVCSVVVANPPRYLKGVKAFPLRGAVRRLRHQSRGLASEHSSSKHLHLSNDKQRVSLAGHPPVWHRKPRLVSSRVPSVEYRPSLQSAEHQPLNPQPPFCTHPGSRTCVQVPARHATNTLVGTQRRKQESPQNEGISTRTGVKCSCDTSISSPLSFAEKRHAATAT